MICRECGAPLAAVRPAGLRHRPGRVSRFFKMARGRIAQAGGERSAPSLTELVELVERDPKPTIFG